jgi:hypothetical protein
MARTRVGTSSANTAPGGARFAPINATATLIALIDRADQSSA